MRQLGNMGEIYVKIFKARAWIIKSKEYIYSDNCNSIAEFFSKIENQEHILELYTGSKDREGTCIYNGDLCEYVKAYSSEPEIETVEIYWETRSNAFRARGNKTNSYGKKSSTITGTMLKVIGHIH
jgi:hypothetical protein